MPSLDPIVFISKHGGEEGVGGVTIGLGKSLSSNSGLSNVGNPCS